MWSVGGTVLTVLHTCMCYTALSTNYEMFWGVQVCRFVICVGIDAIFGRWSDSYFVPGTVLTNSSTWKVHKFQSCVSNVDDHR